MSSSHAGQNSKAKLWSGRVITGLIVLFLVFDGVIHVLNMDFVAEAFTQLGYDPSVSPILGIIELICLALYLIPRTSFFGAILLTGYLGGAVATHVRIGDPLFSHILFPVYIGILLWVGLVLRDQRLQEFITRK